MICFLRAMAFYVHFLFRKESGRKENLQLWKNLSEFFTPLGRKTKLAPPNQRAGLKQLSFVFPRFVQIFANSSKAGTNADSVWIVLMFGVCNLFGNCVLYLGNYGVIYSCIFIFLFLFVYCGCAIIKIYVVIYFRLISQSAGERERGGWPDD